MDKLTRLNGTSRNTQVGSNCCLTDSMQVCGEIPKRVQSVFQTDCVLCISEQATRVRACNYVKIETGRNFPPVLKIVTHTAQAA